MVDLLAHALVGYTLGVALSWRHEWLTAPYVTAVMVGTCVPDLVKVELLAHPRVVVDLTGLPFSWTPLTYASGVALSVLVGVLLVVPRERGRALALLGLGAASHLLLDLLLKTPSGRSFPVFWPLTTYRPPTPGLYLSTEPWPTLVAVGVAAVVWALDRRRRSSTE